MSRQASSIRRRLKSNDRRHDEARLLDLLFRNLLRFRCCRSPFHPSYVARLTIAIVYCVWRRSRVMALAGRLARGLRARCGSRTRARGASLSLTPLRTLLCISIRYIYRMCFVDHRPGVSAWLILSHTLTVCVASNSPARRGRRGGAHAPARCPQSGGHCRFLFFH